MKRCKVKTSFSYKRYHCRKGMCGTIIRNYVPQWGTEMLTVLLDDNTLVKVPGWKTERLPDAKLPKFLSEEERAIKFRQNLMTFPQGVEYLREMNLLFGPSRLGPGDFGMPDELRILMHKLGW